MDYSSTSFKGFIESLKDKNIEVLTSFHSRTMSGKLQGITYKDGDVDGIVLEKWGWISFSSIYRINKNFET